MELGDGIRREIPPPSPETPVSKPQTIFLHILSPSSEVPNKLTFPSIPVATTVGELKIKIQDVVATKPAPGRQRLIYRGKALVKDTDTMKDVFGQETINDPVAHSLHLVLPPSNILPSSVQATSTAPNAIPQNVLSQHPPTPPRPASVDQPPSSAQDRADVGQQHQPTVVRGGFQSPHPHAHHAHNVMPSPQGQIAPHIQAALNNHFAALSQQLGQQLAMGAMTAPGIPARPPQSNQLHQSSTVPQPSFQQVITHQQQARAAAGRQGVADVPAADAANGNTNRQAQAQLPEQATPPGSMPSQTSPGPGSTNTVVHEEQGPNGNNWRITVNESTFTIPNANAGHDHMPGVDTMPLASFGSHGSFNVPADGLSPSMAGLQSEVIQARPTTFSPPDQDLETQRRVWMQLVAPMQQVMSTLERMIASGYAPSEDQVNEVRSQLQDIMRHRNAIPEVHQRTMNARLSYISSGAEQVRRNVGRNATITPNVQQSAMSVPISATPMVYLLSSPSGPHALLVSPSGLYSTAPRIVPFPTDPRPLAANLQQQRFNQAQVPNRLGDIHAQQPAPHDPLNHAQPGQQQWAQARDIARILLPLGGHLWLLIRLFGFVYFFTAGGGWRRAILLGVGAFMVFIAQTGIFRPFQQAVWEPLRRHLEGLVPLAGNERPNVGGAPGAAAPVGVNGDQRPVGGEPEIRQVAERLLRERDQRDVGLVRQYLRRLERAVAIFLASLVPGIGERHIAARDAAEAIRMVEEREREEERVRGEEVPEEQGVGEPTHRETGPNAEANSSNEDNGGVTQPQQPQQGQPPLVEI